MSSDPTPVYVYKIVPTAPSEPLPAENPLSELDAKDGFVHLSTSTQVPNTCNLFFDHASELWIMKLEYAKVQAKTKWEDGFPHLYGNFGVGEVVSVNKYERQGGSKWIDEMKGSSWLE